MYKIYMSDDGEPAHVLHESDEGDVAYIIYRTLLAMVTRQGNKREGDAVSLALYWDDGQMVLEEYKRIPHNLHEPTTHPYN